MLSQKICLILLRVVAFLIMNEIYLVQRIDSAFSQSDVKEAFKDICMGNMNKSIFVHLNIYSLGNKSDLIIKQKKRVPYIFLRCLKRNWMIVYIKVKF